MNKLSVLMAQINPTVGAITANKAKIIQIIQDHQADHDIILFPELALCGYPPEDLLYRPQFHQDIDKALSEIQAMVKECHVILGHPQLKGKQLFNAASLFYQGQKQAEYHKQILPNYGVFDERRYFTPGQSAPPILNIKNQRLAILICEDLWQPGPVEQVLAAGATGILSLNASPFDYDKYHRREKLLCAHAQRGLALFYVNQVGGQDELLFDGQSMAIDAEGRIKALAPAFEENLSSVILEDGQVQGPFVPHLENTALIYKALVCGTRDYVNKNHFPGVLLGLSGGIDSALTLAIAVDALGKDRVEVLMMPSRYTAGISSEDALEELEILGVKHHTLSIEPAYQCLLETLAPLFHNLPKDTTEENLQARIRGMLLMALSNKTGKMVLTTSNKSETAVGYATLYGDMAGGFAVLKDVLKTQVYELARYRNRQAQVIPERVLSRAPSAELADNQTDQDSLPPYPILDAIIQAYMENNQDAETIIAQGYEPAVVNKVIALISRNEYKRRQAAPGIKISARAFGKDWRYPITRG